MARSISLLLVVSLLVLNFAWAVDDCAFITQSEQHKLALQVIDQNPLDSNNISLSCDDWCLSWIGLFAIHSTATLNRFSFTMHTYSNNYTDSYASLLLTPPHHPPIA